MTAQRLHAQMVSLFAPLSDVELPALSKRRSCVPKGGMRDVRFGTPSVEEHDGSSDRDLARVASSYAKGGCIPISSTGRITSILKMTSVL